MTNNQLNRRLYAIMKSFNNEHDPARLEHAYDSLFGYPPKNILHYSAMCESLFANYLKSLGRKREWTWYADISISECFVSGQPGAVLDTCTNAIKHWADNAECMAEFLCSVAMKATEHYEWNHPNWAGYYSDLYHTLLDVVYDYYEDDSEKTGVVWRYLD